MYESRHVNSFGWTQSSYKETGSSGWWTTGPITSTSSDRTVVSHWSLRRSPVTGGRVGNFRLPTSWGMVAANATFYPSSQTFGGSVNWRYTGSSGCANWPYPSPYGFGSGGCIFYDTNLKNRCYTEARDKIKHQHINIGAAIGESRETVKMLIQTVWTLGRVLYAVRKGYWLAAADILGVSRRKVLNTSGIANRWLVLQYGWLPLISDAYALQEQLKEQLTSRHQLLSVTRTLSSDLSPRSFFTGLKSWDKVSGSASQTIRVQYWYRISDPWLHSLSQLGLTNPAGIAWELLPFSFVVDWFFPVGTFLSALDATLGTTFVAGAELTRTQFKLRGEFFARNPSGLTDGGPAVTEYKGYAMTRLKLTGYGAPMPYVKSPWSSTHLLNAIALVRQLS